MYTVTRQLQWPEGTPVVEVSAGGLDYTNPDALVESYPGELQTFGDPREAAETAIAICRAWRKEKGLEALPRVAHGATGGMTMPFEPTSFRQLRAWADRAYQQMPKCDRCGDVLPERHYIYPYADECFCSEHCAEEALREEEHEQTPD